MARFYAIIDIMDEDWDGDKSDLATWIDAAMRPDVDSTVYDSISDLVADHVLEALAGIDESGPA